MLENFTTKLKQKKKIAPDTWWFDFLLIKPRQINFTAGQYLVLKVKGKSRLYSIATPEYVKDRVGFLVKLIPDGLASTYLDSLKVGEKVSFQGPAGLFRLKNNERDKIFLVTGTGIAPIRSMILSQKSKVPTSPRLRGAGKSQKSYLFWGMKKKEDLCFVEEFEKLSKDHPNFKFFICLSREKNLDRLDPDYFRLGRVNPNLADFLHSQSKLQVTGYKLQDFINHFEYYLCGAPPVVDSLKKFLLDLGVKKENIYFEKF